MNSTKTRIEQYLNEMQLNEAAELILEYEKEKPFDMDIITYKCLYFLYNNELDDALEYALLGIRNYPTNGDMYYNAGYIYEILGDLLAACENYTKAKYIYEYTKDEKAEDLDLGAKTDSLMKLIKDEMNMAQNNNNEEYLHKVDKFFKRLDVCFGLKETSYKNFDQIIGSTYWVSDNEKKYIAFYRIEVPSKAAEGAKDLVHMKGELLSVTEGTDYNLNGVESEYLLPVAVENAATKHTFYQEDEAMDVLQLREKLFRYYRVKNGVRIVSDDVSYYGNPIPLGHAPSRKRLVLNIFVDGLSQEILNGDDFQQIMPYTYRFFSKGIICTQAYSTAEWTYPSIANIMTGTDTPNHMLFHDKLDGSIPEDITTIAEYFHNAGYYTAHLTGNWRIIPPYGHCRGYERYIYQNPLMGSKAEIMLADTLEQLDGFKDTDQFVTICMEDLHDIADYLDMPIGVQSKMSLSEYTVDLTGTNNTSVKQTADPYKISVYKKMANHIDMLLNSIYTYIADNYKEEDILISLFADHGQGFLVPKGEKFMCKEREKIAFMFRGGVKTGLCDEIISASDYISIMCKLAGIPFDNSNTVSNLPMCFGGSKEREYALSESIHPKDPYYATFFAKDYTVYFENGVPTGEDGRFELKDYLLTIKDKDGKIIHDKELAGYYMNILMEHIAKLLIY